MMHMVTTANTTPMMISAGFFSGSMTIFSSQMQLRNTVDLIIEQNN